MLLLSNSDLYRVNKVGLIADYDRKAIFDLYQPIVGYIAVSIYMTFWTEAENFPVGYFKTHQLLMQKTHLPTGLFIEERKKLEALGLLKTFCIKDKDYNVYTYDLYAPKTPSKFFSNPLLYGLLLEAIGDQAAQKLKIVYLQNENQDKGKEISKHFAEVYNPDLNASAFATTFSPTGDNILDRLQSHVDSEFNYATFVKMVEQNAQISSANFTKTILKEISRLATLYGINEENAALYTIDCYDATRPSGNKIDMDKLKRRFQDDNKFPNLRPIQSEKTTISSKSQLAAKINLMESVSPKDYLRIKQNNTQPVAADLKIIDDISLNLRLPNNVINAIIDYVLAKNKNVLSRAYTEKVAASIARENILTTYDAMIYLKEINAANKFKKPGKNQTKNQKEEENVENNTDIKEENNSANDDNWDDILSDLDDNE